MTDTPPATAPQIRVIAMPADTNPNGDIFGGWLLSWMDQAAASAAYEAAKGRCVTVAVDGKVTEGVFTFVAIDENKRPRVLPDA